MSTWRRTRIVATLGPATDADGVLAELIGAGVDVFRLNASHATDEELAARLAAVRAACARCGRHVGVLLDLPGPKVRLGPVADGTVLDEGARFTLVAEQSVGDAHRASVSYAHLDEDVSPGDVLLIDDGRLELVVEERAPGRVTTRVVRGGPLLSRKGVNAPGVRLGLPPVTERDRSLVAWALEHGIDWIAQSFVRSAGDVRTLREAVGGAALPILAKIEKREAAEHLEDIVAAADGVMVARGDLGVETSPEQVPILQRRIVSAARAAGKPVLIATEMLDSMRVSPRPTRAEASDVANAIFGWVDAVMLSGETAVGSFPREAVATMARIIDAAEGVLGQPKPPRPAGEGPAVQEAVSRVASELAAELDLAAIVTVSRSGSTARAVARYRPLTPIVAVVPDERVARRLSLVWGVRAVVMPYCEEAGSLLDRATRAVRDAGLIRTGQRIAITAGLTARTPGGTDLVHVRVA